MNCNRNDYLCRGDYIIAKFHLFRQPINDLINIPTQDNIRRYLR